jgi:hypothetical protein
MLLDGQDQAFRDPGGGQVGLPSGIWSGEAVRIGVAALAGLRVH